MWAGVQPCPKACFFLLKELKCDEEQNIFLKKLITQNLKKLMYIDVDDKNVF